jgi:glycosyltransferase involved in cell wall biosynthesis
MRILILNWRDPRSSRGGGAERVTHEIARRLVLRGHEVAWLSSTEAALPDEEQVDGISIVRRGTELTTRLWAPVLARRGFDVIVDAINTVPYLTPLWAAAPRVVFFHQLARDVWWHESPLPVAAVGWVLESAYLRLYRSTPAITVSASTRDDLRRFGLRGRIDVIPLAVDETGSGPTPPKTFEGRLVAAGRLTPSKRFDHAIRALAALRATHPAARLDVIGDGRERRPLAKLAGQLGLEGAVTFHGRVSDTERDRLFAAADALVGTSVREGWGLTVNEAAIRGTPAVVYDIPGFRDAVVDGRTGLLTQPTPDALADAIRWLIADRSRYAEIQAAARRRFEALTWDATTDAFETALVRAAESG